MAKITAIIDIGSNSVRMVIYEKTSRYAFHLLREVKSRVRIGEGAYKNGGNLTAASMERALHTIKEFVSLAKAYKSRKILSVATSALRDAPNKQVFLSMVSKQAGLNIRLIDGNKEAFYGGIAALNMLPPSYGVTIDIGGGSTELALIHDNIVEKTVSLDLGTVRLKELFFDNNEIEEAARFIQSAFDAIDPAFKQGHVFGIGGSIRALSHAYLKTTDYPIKVLHGFNYPVKAIDPFLTQIMEADTKSLAHMGIKPERFDVIGAGALIFQELLKYLQATEITVSSSGVREGVFIEDLLRTHTQTRFPLGVNPTILSLQDRFVNDADAAKVLKRCALSLFDLLHTPLDLPLKYREFLAKSALLCDIGIHLNYHDFERHSFYLILHSLYGLKHKDILLIATLVRYQNKKRPSKDFSAKYEALLPKSKRVKSLILILALARAMLKGDRNTIPFEIERFEDNTLYLKKLQDNHLALEKLAKLSLPFELSIS